MITWAMLSIIEEAATAVLTLTEGIAEDEFRRSRLTRSEVLKQVTAMATSFGNLDGEARKALPEIDWEGWRVVRRGIEAGGDACHEAVWFAIQALIPATMMWLRVYRKSEPGLFSLRM